MDNPPFALSNGRIKIRKGKLKINFPRKIKTAATVIGIIIISDLNLLATFVASALTKDLSDQITIALNIANKKNFI